MEAELERLGASSVHDSHEYRVQEADLGDEVEAELERLEVLSDRSSACDCPAHIHDRESPLEIAQVIKCTEKFFYFSF